MVAVAGGLRGPGDAAKSALIPRLVERAAVPMERATGLYSAVERSAGLLGAAFAGALVAFVGPAQALVVDALSFLVSAVVLGLTTRSLAGPATPALAEPTGPDAPAEPGYLTQLREGWDFLRRDPVLVSLTAMIAVTNLLDLAWASVIVPGVGAGHRLRRGAGRRDVRGVRCRVDRRLPDRRRLGRTHPPLPHLPDRLPGDRAAALRGDGLRHADAGSSSPCSSSAASPRASSTRSSGRCSSNASRRRWSVGSARCRPRCASR